MATAKQKAWRAEFAKRYGHKHAARRKTGGGKMARKHYRRSGGSGMGGLIKKAAFGLGAAYIVGMVTQDKFGLIGDAAAGYVAGGPVGAVAGAIVKPMLKTGSVGGSWFGL